MIVPAPVSGAIVAEGGVPSIAPLLNPRTGDGATFAKPKSSSFTTGGADPPPRTSMMFEGFRSRCTIPSRCALSSASAICWATARA